MTLRHLFVGAVLLCTASCAFFDETYNDDFEVSHPEALSVTILYPGVAEFTFTQVKPMGVSHTSPDLENSVVVKKLAGAGPKMNLLVQLFANTPQTAENIGLFDIVEVLSTEEVIDLGKTYSTPLHSANVKVTILDTGSETTKQSNFRGYYLGTYLLSKEGDQVAVGNVGGYVDYQGYFQFEINGYPGFRFLKGNGVDGASDNDFVINAGLFDLNDASLAVIQDKFTRADEKLSATLVFPNPEFDKIQINLIQQ